MGVNLESLGEEWSGGRIVRREPRLLYGLWLSIAFEVDAGARSDGEIADRLRVSALAINRAVYQMFKYGHLVRDHRGGLALPRRVHRQLVAERSL